MNLLYWEKVIYELKKLKYIYIISIIMNNLKKIEYKIFNSNRFSLKKNEELEISKDLKFSNILILGAAGSIGSEFTKKNTFF